MKDLVLERVVVSESEWDTGGDGDAGGGSGDGRRYGQDEGARADREQDGQARPRTFQKEIPSTPRWLLMLVSTGSPGNRAIDLSIMVHP